MRPVHYLAFVKFALECYKFLDCRNITIQIKEKKIKKQLFLIFCTCVQLRNWLSCRKQANVYLQRSCVSNLLRDGVIYKACFYRKLKQCHTFALCRKKFGWLETNKAAVHKVVNFLLLRCLLAGVHSTTNSLELRTFYVVLASALMALYFTISIAYRLTSKLPSNPMKWRKIQIFFIAILRAKWINPLIYFVEARGSWKIKFRNDFLSETCSVLNHSGFSWFS